MSSRPEPSATPTRCRSTPRPTSNSRSDQKELDRINELDQRDQALNARGLTYGVIVTLAFLAACVFLVASGKGVEGTVLGVVFIIALVAVLAVGRRR